MGSYKKDTEFRPEIDVRAAIHPPFSEEGWLGSSSPPPPSLLRLHGLLFLPILEKLPLKLF